MLESLYYISLPRSASLEREIMRLGTRRELAAKEYLIRSGDTVDVICYLLEGQLTHVAVSDTGVEKAGYSNRPGSFTNEFLFEVRGGSLVAKKYVYANTDSVVYMIGASAYQELRKIPEFLSALQTSFYLKCSALREEVDSISFFSAKERLMQMLIASVDRDRVPRDPGWHSLRVHYTQQEMGAILGIHRVSVARLLAELCEQGSVRVINRRIEVRLP